MEGGFDNGVRHFKTHISGERYEKKMSMIVYSQAPLANLDTLIEKTHKISRSGAYLHHYNKFGIENERIFEYSLPILEQLFKIIVLSQLTRIRLS